MALVSGGFCSSECLGWLQTFECKKADVNYDNEPFLDAKKAAVELGTELCQTGCAALAEAELEGAQDCIDGLRTISINAPLIGELDVPLPSCGASCKTLVDLARLERRPGHRSLDSATSRGAIAPIRRYAVRARPAATRSSDRG